MDASDPGTHGFCPDADACLRGHRALEAYFANLLEVLEDGPQDQVVATWAAAIQGFSEGLRNEERTILADLLVARPGDARALLHEHAHMRGRMAQLRNAMPNLTRAEVQLFFAELRAHDRHEEDVLRQSAF